MKYDSLLSEISVNQARAFSVPDAGITEKQATARIPRSLLRKTVPSLPSVAEPDLCRHFTKLSQKNYAVSTAFYPLGSCTMKYNPPINDRLASLSGFADIHPLQDASTQQGLLSVLYDFERSLCAITGLEQFTLQPAAGAHGELTGLLMIRAYFEDHGQNRTVIVVPDSAHGTNPASAALAGFTIRPIASEPDGHLDPAKLADVIDDTVAAVMLTAPNTLGVFEKDLPAIVDAVHSKGAFLYYDGANLNALLGTARPGDLGFDVMHINLHKTFATPHGGGGPGAGPVGANKTLAPYLPIPRIVSKNGTYSFDTLSIKSIGKVRSFYGNIPVILRAAAYVKALGSAGLVDAGQQAVINANYLLAKLSAVLPAPAGNRCLHEFVLSALPLKAHGVRAIDLAKRLLDEQCYAPTVYFPLIVPEAVMIEPTETESRRTLDEFAAVFTAIIKEAGENPQSLTNAPITTPVSRLNEVEAARKPVVRWQDIS